ncbi:insulinase family protein [Paenibacillus wulumuqiensis]|uniref:insulinase family protein n=1 Tax=Paenibacillus wulumuqiensis TaxID=1567107 RepID=UPI000619C02B|nr:insulinase family protein [Paenibacillus wulumuqiensis]
MNYESTAYRVIQRCELEDLKSQGVLLEHIQSGARIVLLGNDDDNKVFSIGFRTPATNNNGMTHILEHSVLCGSERFPAKDTFVELAKGTLNTFLNAMTFPDKTIYPVASQNDQDFQNLMAVYMDAVLKPNVRQQEQIFMQEGWHYSLESADAELHYNGVVYNEMKGAFSNPDSVMQGEISRSLFPDTTYAYEYGGLPEEITQLKYEDLQAFHQKYYHPSNSYIYLYGNMDMNAKLDWLDENYLSQYDRVRIDSAVKHQAPFSHSVEVEKFYSIGSQESEQGRVIMSYNAVIGTNLDSELRIAFKILQYVLFNAPGAPVQQALLESGLARETYASFTDSLFQPVFSIFAKNGERPDKQQFIDTLTSVLQKAVQEGIDREALLACINVMEFQYREADFGSFPKGLVYGMQILDSWLYDDQQPFIHLEANRIFDRLKTEMNDGWFEQLVEKYLLNNTHASIVTLLPVRGLNMQKEQQLKEQLQVYKNSLTSGQIQELVRQTEMLTAYRNQPSPSEQRSRIPLLSRQDIQTQASLAYPVVHEADGTTILHNRMSTNGIAYVQILFDLSRVPGHLLPYVGILRDVLGTVDTDRYSYNKLSNEINLHSGGIFTQVSSYADTRRVDRFATTFELHAKVLYSKLDFVFDIIREVICTSSFANTRRIYEIIAEIKSRRQMDLISEGHQTAITRAFSYHTEAGVFEELVEGIAYFQLIDQLERNYEKEQESLVAALEELMIHIFRPENMTVNYTAENNSYPGLVPLVKQLKSHLHTEPTVSEPYRLSPLLRNEGFITSSEVQYVAQTGSFLQQGFAYHGSLRVLSQIIAFDYLWQNIRVEGGAYGSMIQFQRNGSSFLASYRDPNLARTYEVYAGTADYVRSFTATETEMTRYILGAIKDLDTPMSPYEAGLRGLSLYMTSYGPEDVQREREEVLDTTAKHITDLAPLVEAVLASGSLCTIGNESKIKEEGSMFAEVLPLYN